MSGKFERQPESYEDEERQEREWWRLTDRPHPGSEIAKQELAENQALARYQSELSQLDYADPSKRHERNQLRQRMASIEATRAIRELVCSNTDDPETAASLREIHAMLNDNAGSFKSREDKEQYWQQRFPSKPKESREEGSGLN